MKNIMTVMLASLFVFSSTAFAGGFLDNLTPDPTCQAVRGGFKQMNRCATAQNASQCAQKNACLWTSTLLSCENIRIEEIEDIDCSLSQTPRACNNPSLRRFCVWQ